MEQFILQGGQPVRGEVTPSGNKNAALPLLAACLLTDEPLTLHNVPRIGDIATLLEILRQLGVAVDARPDHSVRLCAKDVQRACAKPSLLARLRGSLTLLGPLLARLGCVGIPAPGGDQIGRRRIDTHLLALEALGAAEVAGELRLGPAGLRGADVLLDEASVTATENAVMAATLAKGTTVLRNAASEPHVEDLCRCLDRMGARIEGIGSNILTIEGVDRLGGGEFTISPDHIEVGSFVGLGAVTRGELRIKGVRREQLRMVDWVFRKRLGVRMRYEEDLLVVEDEQDLVIQPDAGGAVPKIENAPWPGFPADLLSIALIVATQARGTVLIHDKMFESRLYFTDRLISMGAQIILCDPHRAVIVGPSALRGGTVVSPDIRAGMALVLAALCAEGPSQIGNVDQIDRGYERLEDKLRALGVRIKRVTWQQTPIPS
ncbi:MAG: UDP-N-acetylglucosamine 1-carboxyvinyltransferase [Deltaproteobacteria bacterium]|nr:UDP-N-acetylglucosamine 1-carboxyvinyltransferase [Deltaproteobacteria bacterium]